MNRSIHCSINKLLVVRFLCLAKVGRTDDGVYLFQGDIKINQKQLSKLTAPGNKGRKKRALLSDKTSLWQSPIYYALSPGLSSK
jgi:hypothetical protein